MFRSLDEMKAALDEQFVLDRGQVIGFPAGKPGPGAVDAFARNAVFNPDPTLRAHLRRCLRSAAAHRGMRSASIADSVERLSRPWGGALLAVRLGGHCYDLMRLVMRAARCAGSAGLVFEQGWLGQSPWEFSALLSAAALREEWPAPLYMRCCLPPLASDLLPGGLDLDSLEERLTVAAGADFHNLTLRISPAGLLRERSRGELRRLLRQARQEGMAVNLRVEDPGVEDGDELMRALAIATEEAPPLLLALPSRAQLWPTARQRNWVLASGARGLSMSGATAEEQSALPPRTPVLECRVDFQWARRIVMSDEYNRFKRRELLAWLRSAASSSASVDDATLLQRHEFQALGHLDFHLWDLEELPRFREETLAQLEHLHQALQPGTAPGTTPHGESPSPGTPPPAPTLWEEDRPGLL